MYFLAALPFYLLYACKGSFLILRIACCEAGFNAFFVPQTGTFCFLNPVIFTLKNTTETFQLSFSIRFHPDKTVAATVFSSFFPDKIINSIIEQQLQPAFQNIIQLIHIQRFRDMSIHACIFCQLYIFCKSICCHGNNR